ncbi:hypothetical protein AU074_08910 [Pseudomonas sp. ATCC PTA-122608]|uniref:hypothetical protein n=1 Tax=Pseudomonas sp. ATCC PTA-122608 TaxID=1771311 RepID=UPI00096B72B5|nr:hypothetical protein [Pseudomonas sp. ATCC PTA-122608]OLY72823.1 hypothetical protein AU074_08910 [Pseudomonas sp. ATCC PTA-122608]
MDIPSVIAYAMDPIKLSVFGIIVFFASLCFFSRFIKTDIGWKRIDYFWLLFGAIGLVAACNVVKKDWYETQVSLDRGGVENLWRNVVSVGAKMGSPDMCASAVIDARPIPSARDERIRACTMFEQYVIDRKADELTRIRFYDALRLAGALKTQYKDPEVINRLTGLEKSFDELSKAEKELRNHEFLLEEAKGSREFTYLFPYLFVLAVAIRLAKVRGEINLSNRSREKQKAQAALTTDATAPVMSAEPVAIPPSTPS